MQLVAVTEVDFHSIGSGQMGPVVSRLRQLFFEIVRGKSPKYRDWCMPVYTAAE